MKKIILVCLCLLFTAPVFAANWVQVGYKSWMDLDSVKYGNDMVNAWFKDLNPGDWELSKGKRIYYTLNNMTFWCSRREFSLQATGEYDLKENLIRTENYRGYQWESIFPESIGESKYNAACSLLRKN